MTYLIFLILGLALNFIGQFTGDALESDMDLHGLPFASIRFWSIFAAMFGLSGLVLTLFMPFIFSWATGILSAGIGLGTGMIYTKLIKSLDTSSEVDSQKLIGQSARVLLPVSKNTPGKIRVIQNGKILDFTAKTTDKIECEINSKVLIYKVNKNGSVNISK
jgi:hypothetical protein